MGAAALMHPGTQAGSPRETVGSMGEAVHHAVDLYDAAAQLESQGYGDSVARQGGFRDVFEMAGELMGGTRARHKRRAPRGLGAMVTAALGRMIVLVAGVLISLAVLPAGSSHVQVFVAGAVGWLCGQAVSAGIWRGLGTSVTLAAQTALTSAPVLLVLAGVVSLAAWSWAPLLWAMWSVAASVLVIMRPGVKVVLLAMGGAALSLAAGQYEHSLGMACGAGAIVVACLGALVVLRREKVRPARPSRPIVKAQVLGLLQAAAQLVVLGLVLIMIGPTVFVAVAVAGLVAGSLSDPILELVHAAVRHLAAFPLALRAGRFATATLGILGIAMVMVIALLTAILVRDIFAPGETLLPVILATALVAGLTAGTGLLLRAGTAVGAMALAMGVAALALLGEGALLFNLHSDVTLTLEILSLLAVVATAWLAARHMSHPSAW